MASSYLFVDKRWNIVLNCSFWGYLTSRWHKWGYQVHRLCRFREDPLFSDEMAGYHIKLQSCAPDSQKEAIMCKIWCYIWVICKFRLRSYWSVLRDEGQPKSIVFLRSKLEKRTFFPVFKVFSTKLIVCLQPIMVLEL